MVTVSPRTQFVILTVPTAVLKANTSTAMGRCETFSIKHAPHSLKKKKSNLFSFFICGIYCISSTVLPVGCIL